MASKSSTTLVAVATIAMLLGAVSAHAVEVKKSLYSSGGAMNAPAGGGNSSGPAPANPLNAAQKQALQDAVANDSEQTLGEESEKKSSGKDYVDLEHAKFSYMPTAGAVTAKLTGHECKGKKGGATGACSPSGTDKTLVFKYKIKGNSLAAEEAPKWEEPKTQTATEKK
ncbi:MAG: hypothetical protein JWM69_1570 [Candidatus Binatus sp.]|jgi:hypothetical protein|nr:hypothetical protein [Candidatus Binatus sp.]